MASSSTMEDTSSQPSSILLRNRENQRASRARRKGYIEDLERRVRRFECDGAAATVEVQFAARRVAEENFWLRRLLNGYGVAKDEVDGYVERNRPQAANVGQPVQSVKLLPLSTTINGISPRNRKRKLSELSQRELEAARTLAQGQSDGPMEQLMPAIFSSWEPTQSPHVAREPLSDLPTPEDSNASEHERTESASSELQGPSSEQEQDRYHPSVAAAASISAYAQNHSPSTQRICLDEFFNHPRQTDVTPCEEAAQIIASMRGHEDMDSVWPELGCSSDARCTVKNITIFQLGDMETRHSQDV